MDKPFQIIKAFEKLEDAENFKNGNIWLHSVSYYLRNEKNKQDPYECQYTEGSRTSEISRDKTFILCFHNIPLINSKHGNYKVLILNPCNLFDKISNKLSNLKIIPLLFGNIIYGVLSLKLAINTHCGMQINRDPKFPPFEEIAFQKNIYYEDEQEARMCFYLLNNDINNDNGIKIKFYKYDFLKHDWNKEITLKQWKNRFNDTQDDGEGYCIKVVLSNISFESELIKP